MSRDRLALDARLHLVSRLRFVEGLTETEIRDQLAADGLPVSRSTISRDIGRARKQIEEQVGSGFNPRAVLGAAIAQLDHIIFDALHTGQTASFSGKAALHRVATIAIAEKIRILTETGLLNRAAFLVRIRAVEPIPTGEELAELFRTVDVSEVISDAERAFRYGEHAAARVDGE